MNWFDLEEKDRIKKVFSNYTIKQFWDWWSDKEHKFMEIRITDYVIIRETSEKFNLPYSYSGVYVKNDKELKNVIAYVRDKATMWFGVNPRFKNWCSKGFKTFGSGRKGGSSTENISEIKFIFIDVDRVIKGKQQATNEELKNTDILVDKILKMLSKEKWSKNFLRICSGNGEQLIIKLDVPIKMPTIDFDNELKIFIQNDEFTTISNLISKGIGKQILTFCNKFKEELGVEVDKTAFRIAQVAALPFTKNYKYDSFTWRGILDLKNEDNTGLSDYVLLFEDDIKTFKTSNIFKSKSLTRKNRLQKGKLMDNELVQFMLNHNFPQGGINNTIWFQLKILLRDSKYDLNSKEFITFHRMICNKHQRSFTLNYPDKQFVFSEDVVNSYCINNVIKPIYKLWPNRTKNNINYYNIGSFNDCWINSEIDNHFITLKEETTIQEDLFECKKLLTNNSMENKIIIEKFINGCKKKYGKQVAKYYCEFLFFRGINYS